MKSKIIFLFTLCLTCFFGCQSPGANPSIQQTDSSGDKKPVGNPADIPEDRPFPQKAAVDSFKEKTDNPLNDWYFSVKLYETSKTFKYQLKMKFEELEAEDELNLPNFGMMPKPVLKKGNDKYSCIIGFMDADKQFREYKLVHIENSNQLKVTTLKHYAVTASPQ